MRIENWSIMIHDSWNQEYQTPELFKSSWLGKIYDHPDHEDGECIITSSIKGFERNCILTASGSKFEIGKINPRYLDKYPNILDLLYSKFSK